MSPLPEQQRIQLRLTAERIIRVANRQQQGVDWASLLERIGRQRKQVLILIDQQNNQHFYGFPRRMRPPKALLGELGKYQQPLLLRTANGVYAGPYPLVFNQRHYLLYAGRPVPKSLLRKINASHPGLLLLVSLLISGGLCLLLAWSLLKPIRQLKEAAQKMSQGDLTARVGDSSQRRDELGQLGKEFNGMAGQLDKLLKAQKRLLADISHELRSPLARQQLAIGLAQQGEEQGNPQAAAQQLPRIEKESQQMANMLGQLLTLARLENPEQVQQYRLTLAEVLRPILEDATFEASSLGKQVCYQPSPVAEKVIEADGQLLSSAIENVLRNAIKYANNQVQVSLQVNQQELLVQIADDGPGVPEASLANLFTPFYRESASRSRDSGGVGLGLAIACQAMLANGGSIKAENRPAGGLLVSLGLPCCTAC